MRRLPHFIGILIILLCSCHRDPIWQTLNIAESLMEEHPDSALVLLTNIDGSTLKGEAQARHALLLSQAYDKNYIDLTSDSLISIATSYYNKRGDNHYKLMANYYSVVIYMNGQDYDDALTLAFDAEKFAEELHDIEYMARVQLLIARAYLFSFNQEGAKAHFEKSLDLMRQLQKPEWTGTVFINLANLALIQKDYNRAIESVDSAKVYIPNDPDLPEYEMLAYIGLDNYEQADSIFDNHILNPSIQAKAYKLLAEFHVGKSNHIEDSLQMLLSNSSHFDSIYVASVGSQINHLTRDYEKAWKYADVLLQELNNEIDDISSHSLYLIQLEHNKTIHAEAERHLQNKYIISLFIGIIAVLIIVFGIIYLRYLRKRHKEQIARTKDEVLFVSLEFAEMQANLQREINRQNKELVTLNHQIHIGQIAAQELFMSKYAWIEELGNIFIDAESSKVSTNRAMRDLKKRLDTVKTQKFTENLTEVINKYCNNLINRVKSECPTITDSERKILALLCANLSTRIISFILNISPRTVYNVKHSIKCKLETNAPTILLELPHVFA